MAFSAHPLLGQSPLDTLRLTLGRARERALASNPELAAARPMIDVARGDLRQAGVLPFNPSAEALASGSGGLGPEYALTQEIEIGGQRGLRKAAARAGLERAMAGVRDRARVTLGAVDRTFFRLVAAQRRATLAAEVVALNRNLVDIAGRQLKEGEVSRLDFNLASVELGRAQARLLAAESDRYRFDLELRRLLGSPAVAALAPVVDSLPSLAAASILGPSSTALEAAARTGAADSLLARALERRPDLAERSHAVRQARSEAALARRGAVPNLVARAASERADGGMHVVRPGLGLTLPLFNRSQGEADARAAAARTAELGRLALVSSVSTEIGTAVRAYSASAARAELLRANVLPQAQQNRQLLEVAYREGKVGLPVLLLIRNQAIDAELEYWDAWLGEWEALADVAEATGLNIER